MGYVNITYNYKTQEQGLIFKPYKTDLGMFNVVKVRDKTSCGNCKKAILPKSYCYGKGWIRLCLKCGEEFSHTAIGGFEDIIKMIKENQNELKQNKEKWKAENILANL